jgi:hypothetical protein
MKSSEIARKTSITILVSTRFTSTLSNILGAINYVVTNLVTDLLAAVNRHGDANIFGSDMFPKKKSNCISFTGIEVAVW